MTTATSFGGSPRAANSGTGPTIAPAPNGAHASGELAVLGAGVIIKGSVEADLDLQIDGRVEGDVRAGTLIVSERGVVAGSIVADRVRVAGRVEGGIEAVDLAVEAGAHIRGDVTYSRLRISNGGVFEGNMVHRPIDPDGADSERLKLLNGSDSQNQPRVHYVD